MGYDWQRKQTKNEEFGPWAERNSVNETKQTTKQQETKKKKKSPKAQEERKKERRKKHEWWRLTKTKIRSLVHGLRGIV